MKIFLPLILCTLLLACTNSSKESSEPKEATPVLDEAQKIVNRAIEKHGGAVYDDLSLAFDFRDRHYEGMRKEGKFVYKRLLKQEDGTELLDILNNEKLIRQKNGEEVALSAKDSSAYANSVNSVFYFALLPYFLNDPAANKTYLGQAQLKGKPYHKIKVTFQQEDGGKDFEDEFVYWIHAEDYTMDYLAYNYLTDGGGARFREAYNVRTVKGVRFADYINYKPELDSRAVENFDTMLEAGQMKEVSRIDTENVEVKVGS